MTTKEKLCIECGHNRRSHTPMGCLAGNEDLSPCVCKVKHNEREKFK